VSTYDKEADWNTAFGTDPGSIMLWAALAFDNTGAATYQAPAGGHSIADLIQISR
jgi:hypothetical protein